MQRKISILIIAVLMLNMLLGATAGAVGNSRQSLSEPGATASMPLNTGNMLLSKGLLAAISSAPTTYSPTGTGVPVTTKLEVKFGSNKVRTNGQKRLRFLGKSLDILKKWTLP